MALPQTATVVAVAADRGHNFSKPIQDEITLIAGLGVEGDAHAGVTVQHLFDKKRNPDAPNLRQVHFMHAELFDELAALDIDVSAGQMGENLVTRGVPLLDLPTGTRFQIGEAIIEITGLRNPCKKLNTIHPDLLKAVVEKRPDGSLNKKTGVMSIVIQGGKIMPGDIIHITYPDGDPVPLECV
ncbi:MOSC domain-containing protein [Litorimonas sp. RW-G-Af-16]|uniref:MOSC domain-containing protein n=1 Tax=Litorimonas sp. RW-G-Af-16 TaxID=3241168 RepID=UPI00390C48D6